MARRRRSRKRTFNLRKVRIEDTFSLGALASLDVVSSALITTATNPYRLMSIDVSWSLSDLGASADDTCEFGVAHSDYTSAEIEECLESQASIDFGNKIANEQAQRLVRSIGIFTGTGGTGASSQYNEGRPMKTKLNWYIGIGDHITVWARNGSGTVYTTGADIVSIGVMWVKPSV